MKDYKSPLKTVGGNEGSKCYYPTRLDTYSSCAHDCKYCFAKSLLDFRGMWDAKHPAIGDMQKISKEIRKLPREVVRLGGMTDCFQPLEKLHRNTYKAISLLNRRKIPYLIVTKSALVAEPEYLNLMDAELAHIQITVTTLDDKLCATYEKASPPSERIRAIRTLQERGFDVQLRLSPFIPDYVDTGKLGGLNVDKILVEFLRVNPWIRQWFDIDYSEYTVKQGGYQHLPLETKLKYIDRIKGFKEMTVCEDETRAYEYWKGNFNHNPNDCCNLRGSK